MFDAFALLSTAVQIVIWKREALNAFCDAQIEMLDMERQVGGLWLHEQTAEAPVCRAP